MQVRTAIGAAPDRAEVRDRGDRAEADHTQVEAIGALLGVWEHARAEAPVRDRAERDQMRGALEQHATAGDLGTDRPIIVAEADRRLTLVDDAERRLGGE